MGVISSPLHVLAVDDSNLDRKLIERLLKTFSYHGIKWNLFFFWLWFRFVIYFCFCFLQLLLWILEVRLWSSWVCKMSKSFRYKSFYFLLKFVTFYVRTSQWWTLVDLFYFKDLQDLFMCLGENIYLISDMESLVWKVLGLCVSFVFADVCSWLLKVKTNTVFLYYGYWFCYMRCSCWTLYWFWFLLTFRKWRWIWLSQIIVCLGWLVSNSWERSRWDLILFSYSFVFMNSLFRKSFVYELDHISMCHVRKSL